MCYLCQLLKMVLKTERGKEKLTGGLFFFCSTELFNARKRMGLLFVAFREVCELLDKGK